MEDRELPGLRAPDGVTEDFAPSTFDVARLQAIAALDVRCLNSDRNAANLVPATRRKISTGSDRPRLLPARGVVHRVVRLVLDRLEGCERAGRPAGQSFDSVVGRGEDATALRDALGLRPKSLRLLIAATKLLQKGVRAGLTIRDVAELVVKPDDSSRTWRESCRYQGSIGGLCHARQ